MAQSFTGKKRIRKSFGRIPEAVQMPNLIEVQRSSYEQFLQREIKDDVPTWLWAVAYTLVIASWVVLVLFFGWCYSSAARGARTPAEERQKIPA